MAKMGLRAQRIATVISIWAIIMLLSLLQGCFNVMQCSLFMLLCLYLCMWITVLCNIGIVRSSLSSKSRKTLMLCCFFPPFFCVHITEGGPHAPTTYKNWLSKSLRTREHSPIFFISFNFSYVQAKFTSTTKSRPVSQVERYYNALSLFGFSMLPISVKLG